MALIVDYTSGGVTYPDAYVRLHSISLGTLYEQPGWATQKVAEAIPGEPVTLVSTDPTDTLQVYLAGSNHPSGDPQVVTIALDGTTPVQTAEAWYALDQCGPHSPGPKGTLSIKTGEREVFTVTPYAADLSRGPMVATYRVYHCEACRNDAKDPVATFSRRIPRADINMGADVEAQAYLKLKEEAEFAAGTDV